MATERVQKILAQAGLASRRKAEELIKRGEVTVNGKVVKLGDKADPARDAIKVSGKLLHRPEAPVYLAFYKPRGVLSTLADPAGRPTLSDYLKRVGARVFPVGRLDFNSEGLLLLTNDGDLAQKLQKNDEVLRVYQVKVKGHPDESAVARLAKGARIEERMIRPAAVRVAQKLANKAVVELVFRGMGGGDLKKMFEAKGLLVDKMVRVAIGHLTLTGLRPGTYRILKSSQVDALIRQPELGDRLWLPRDPAR